VTRSATRVQTAHADAWEVSGRLRVADGGGATEVTGARLSSSGLPKAQWNTADVYDLVGLDLEAARDWFAERGPDGAGVPWGVHVPAGAEPGHGTFVKGIRLLATTGPDLRPADPVPGLVLRDAGPDDADLLAGVDAAAFGDAPDESRAWMRPYLTAPETLVLLAELDGDVVGTATGLRTDGPAGPCVEVSGVAVVPAARRRGVGAALTSAVATWAFASGADLAWLCAETDAAVRVYDRLGFGETPGLDVYEDL
jgi:GNAT superfamily N-acetyltransferase